MSNYQIIELLLRLNELHILYEFIMKKIKFNLPIIFLHNFFKQTKNKSQLTNIHKFLTQLHYYYKTNSEDFFNTS